MRYHIDTIPIWDAYKSNTECPLCILESKDETKYIESFLGSSYMEPSLRIETNEKGFCAGHFAKLYTQKNRLGLALMTHSHLKELYTEISDLLSKAKMSVELESAKPIHARLIDKLKSSAPRSDIQAAAQAIQKKLSTCAVCERISSTLDRYAYTIVYMWRHESDFKTALSGSKGFCLKHLPLILNHASELSGKELTEFMNVILDITEQNMTRTADDLEWFTQKFDHKNREAPWGNSADAVERTIQKIKGPFLPEK